MSRTKIDIVTALAETFGRKLSEPALKLYVAALCDLSDSEASRAAATATQRSKFFPTPSELIELSRTGGVSYEAQAVVAFQELEAALNASKPSVLSPLAQVVVRQLGGFQSLLTQPLERFYTWTRKDFCQIYATMARENPNQLCRLGSAGAEIAGALLDGRLKLIGREDTKAIEDGNRLKIAQLKGD
jgi:hypothetical protein